MNAGLVSTFIIFLILACGCTQYLPPPGEPIAVPESTVEVTTPPPGAPSTPEMQENESFGDIQFIPGGEYHVGDRILISGTTNLRPGNNLLIEVISVSFGPTIKGEDGRFYGVSDVVTVKPGPEDGNNTWSYLLDTTNFAPDRYNVLISGITTKTFKKSAYFELLS
ncbi:MAG TPA: hypothetical protein VMW63_04780 [Methanoregulaceae archaeon]|nr:hypothetical protein [Methanoregulaceae archaeon]